MALSLNLERLKNQLNQDESSAFPISGSIDSANLTGVQSVVNVKDSTFGAVGDGVHDDTAAIQAAISSVASTNGGVVFFPPGLYRLTSTLTSRTTNVTLTGQVGGQGQWPKVANGNTVIFTPIGAGGFDFNVAGPGTVFSGPTIQNLAFSPPYSTLSSAQTLGATLNISSSSSARLAASGTAIVQDKHQIGVFTYTAKTTNQLQGITVTSESVPGATYTNTSVVTNPSPYGARLARTTDFHVERCTFMHYADTTPSILLDDAVHSLSGATGLIVDGSANVAQYGTSMNNRFYGCYRGCQEYSASTRWIGGDFDTNLNGGTPWTGSIGWNGQSSNPCTFIGTTMHGADILWQSDGGMMTGCRYECWKTAAVNVIGGDHVQIIPASMNNFQAGAIGTGVIFDATTQRSFLVATPIISTATRYTDAGTQNTVIDTAATKFSGPAAMNVQSGNTGTGLAVTTNDAATGSQGVAITCATGGGTAHAHALTANLTGTGNAFSSAANFVSSNAAASCVQVSGSETGRGSIKVTHTGDGTSGDANASALSIDLQPAGTACQGIHIDSAAAGTTGALVDVRNNGNQLFKMTSDATFAIPILVLGNGGPVIRIGTGAPAVAAPVGSLYLRTDGGAATTLYVKESGTGTSGWVGK